MQSRQRVANVILFNKPYGVLCQFSGGHGRPTLKDFVPAAGVYPAGRLDLDSEGLVLLTGDGALQSRIAHPKHKLDKTYLCQVEGQPCDAALAALRNGVDLGDFVTRPAQAMVVAEPAWLWPRDPPIRYRKSVPTAWLSLTIREGRNRQVRRMTARVGLPTLRLVRWSVGPWTCEGLAPGECREVSVDPAALATRGRGRRFERV